MSQSHPFLSRLQIGKAKSLSSHGQKTWTTKPGKGTLPPVKRTNTPSTETAPSKRLFQERSIWWKTGTVSC